MKISLIVGARPNFVKAAAILHAAKKFPQAEIKLIHTGQHQDIMSDPYFKDLCLPAPDETPDWKWLGVEKFCGFNSVNRLSLMIDFLSDCFEHRTHPDYVMVVGDTDSTLAGALASVKMGIPVAHVEAGLRCGDRKMQEEINRILVDSVSTKLYTTTDDARVRLVQEGHDWDNTVFAGNVMVDTLYRFLPGAKKRYQRSDPYAVLTLHRPELVDDEERFSAVLGAVSEISNRIPIIWPVHPRVKTDRFVTDNITKTSPMGYLEFISLLAGASFVMTDSGGVQEETTALSVRCFTLRENTERPETVRYGSNFLVGTDPYMIQKRIEGWRDCMIASGIPDLWDGHAAERILEDLCATS